MRPGPSLTILCALLISSGCAHFVFAQTIVALKGEVSADNINLRADSTPVSEVICTVARGTKLDVIREYYDWYKVRLPASAPSYIKKRFVACLDEVAQPVCSNARVISSRVNIRCRPSENSAIVGKAGKTEAVKILGEENGWYKIRPVMESYAWIHKKFVRIIPGDLPVESVKP